MAAGFQSGLAGFFLFPLVLGSFSLPTILENFAAFFDAFFPGAFALLDAHLAEENLFHQAEAEFHQYYIILTLSEHGDEVAIVPRPN